jgi:hypothetical protein
MHPADRIQQNKTKHTAKERGTGDENERIGIIVLLSL